MQEKDYIYLKDLSEEDIAEIEYYFDADITDDMVLYEDGTIYKENGNACCPWGKLEMNDVYYYFERANKGYRVINLELHDVECDNKIKTHLDKEGKEFILLKDLKDKYFKIIYDDEEYEADDLYYRLPSFEEFSFYWIDENVMEYIK